MDEKTMRILLVLALTTVLVACATTKRTYDPTTGALISEEQVYDVQTTMLFMEAALSGAERLSELYAQRDRGEDVQGKIDEEQRRLELATAAAQRLLPIIQDPVMRGKIEQIVDSYKKPRVAAKVAKDALKAEAE